MKLELALQLIKTYPKRDEKVQKNVFDALTILSPILDEFDANHIELIYKIEQINPSYFPRLSSAASKTIVALRQANPKLPLEFILKNVQELAYRGRPWESLDAFSSFATHCRAEISENNITQLMYVGRDIIEIAGSRIQIEMEKKATTIKKPLGFLQYDGLMNFVEKIYQHYYPHGFPFEYLVDVHTKETKSDEGFTPLGEAILRKDILRIRRLLIVKASVDGRSRKGVTPLILAAATGQNDIAQLLIQHEANTNSKDHMGWTPLVHSVVAGYLDVITTLIKNKAAVNITVEIEGFTLNLMDLAYWVKNGAIINILATHGLKKEKSAALQQLKAKKQTIETFFEAVEKPDISLVSELLQNYPWLNNYTTEGGTSGAYLAVMQNNIEMLNCLKSFGANFSNPRLIYQAVTEQHLDCLEWLLDIGISPNSDFGGTPLVYRAVEKNFVVGLKLLLKSGANANAEYKGVSALYLAVQKNHDKCLLILIEHDAFVNVCCEGTPAIYKAASENHIECLKLLIKHGANVNQDNKGVTPVYRAVACNHHESVELLVNAGADLNRQFTGVSPTYLATQKGHSKCLTHLISGGADIDAPASEGATPVYKASAEGQDECLKLLLRARATPNPSLNGCSAVYIAAQNNHLACVELLLNFEESKARIDEPFEDYTPLMKAALENNPEVIKVLLKNGANTELTFQEKQGHTALYLAASCGNCEAVQALLDGGANKNALTEDGHGAINIAIEKGFRNCARFIRDHGAPNSIHTSRQGVNIVFFPEENLPQLSNLSLSDENTEGNVTAMLGGRTITAKSVQIYANDLSLTTK